MTALTILRATLDNWRFVLAMFAFSLVSAIIAVPVIDNAADRMRDIYDSNSPPASVMVEKLPSPDGEARLRMVVTKLRDCELINVQAYEAYPGGKQRISALRADATVTSNIPPGMTVRGGVWRIWPVTGGAIELRMIYDCGGRVVRLPVGVA